MTEPTREPPRRAPQEVPLRAVLAALAAVSLLLALVALWSRSAERAVEERTGTAPPVPEAGEPPRAVFAGPIDAERPGERLAAEAGARLATWSWEDRERGLVRVPIERALDIAAASSRLMGEAVALPRLERADVPARPRPEDDVRVDEKPGAPVPLDLRFVDERGQARKLGEAVSRERPTVLVLAYERCPNLCGLVLRGLAEGLRASGARPGEDYALLVVSLDPRESPATARRQQGVLLDRLGRPDAGEAVRFLVGGEAEIAALASSVGFVYARIPGTDDLAHPAVAIVLAPGGRVARYLEGVVFEPGQVRAALADAAAGRARGSLERLLLRCGLSDPATRRYALAIRSSLRLLGLSALAAVAGLVVFAVKKGARPR